MQMTEPTGRYKIGDVVEVLGQEWEVVSALPCGNPKYSIYVLKPRLDKDGPPEPMKPRPKYNHPAGHRWQRSK